jgi:hypothetical protein
MLSQAFDDRPRDSGGGRCTLISRGCGRLAWVRRWAMNSPADHIGRAAASAREERAFAHPTLAGSASGRSLLTRTQTPQL